MTITPQRATSIELAKAILELTTASFVDADEFDKFVKMMNIKAGQQKVDFIQRLLALIKRLPEKLVEHEKKLKIVQSGQEYLDKAIEEEEELLEKDNEE